MTREELIEKVASLVKEALSPELKLKWVTGRANQWWEEHAASNFNRSMGGRKLSRALTDARTDLNRLVNVRKPGYDLTNRHSPMMPGAKYDLQGLREKVNSSVNRARGMIKQWHEAPGSMYKKVSKKDEIAKHLGIPSDRLFDNAAIEKLRKSLGVK